MRIISFLLFLLVPQVAWSFDSGIKTKYLLPQAEVSVKNVLILPAKKEFFLDLEINMKEGWKTYYKTEEVYLEVTHNKKLGEIIFPDPQEFYLWGDYKIVGYKDRVIFKVGFSYDDVIKSEIDLFIPFCSNQCIVEEIKMAIY